MKLGLVYDCCVPNSFYVKDNVSYDFVNNEPYTHHHSASPSCPVGGWNFPFLWGDGCFLNLHEWIQKGLDFPDYELDIILYANQRVGLDDENYYNYGVERLKKKYPNAKIIGWVKEVELSIHKREERTKNWPRFFRDCDDIAAHAVENMKEIVEYKQLESLIGKKFNFLPPGPINIDLFYDMFYSNEKELSIYAYLPNPIHRRGDTYEFADYIGKKYNIPVRYKPLNENQEFYHLSGKDFIKLWSTSLFHFNLDSSIKQPGIQGIQVANAGSINIGGNNESHHILFPETATCDKKILEEKFVEYLEDENKRFQVIEYAWNKLNELYSFNTVKSQVKELYEKNR